jgi:RNA-directed DNA polymerase
MKPLPKWEGKKLHSLMPLLCRRKTLQAAWEQVRKNGGAPGVDGETVEEFGEHAAERLWGISEALRTHTWAPLPLKRVWIPKPDGTKRGLAIPSVKDRIVHAALAMVLYSVFEDIFGEACFAYVPGKNAQGAVERIWTKAREGKTWVVETDVAKFFDTMGRQRVVDKLAVRIADGSILRLVSAVMRSGVLGETTGENEVGIPQGSPLSPLLANIYLAEFDRKVGERWALTRYADDLVVQCATREEAEVAQGEMEAALAKEGLSMKPEKTRVAHLSMGIEFLGYYITDRRRSPSERSVQKFREKVRSLTLRHDTRPLNEVIARVMPVIRGWTNYFRLAQKDPTIWRLSEWVLDRVRGAGFHRRIPEGGCRQLPTSLLYGMGLRLPYAVLTGWSP